ncbi:hypothetical protein Daus18300_005790 [Diaporthe australafricana]|uniref:Glucose-methanol-choline oxidoreductase N-terminal domain-containing protein n=1 Tax=Diaporthe australafricana TaxID=127596 RepID=A0ABR3X040_9PEZI
MFLNRGAAADYNNWERLGNPGWDFEGLLPYFIKSSMFSTPSMSLAEEFNMTWDLKLQKKGLEEVGLQTQIEGAGGNAHGIIWIPNAIDNESVTRSYARSGYFDPIANRSNLQVVTMHRVSEVLFDDKKHATGIRVWPRNENDTESSFTVNARKEIIITSGALHSPQILQRSGVGPAEILQKADIPIVVDLPGVGMNLQDHPTSRAWFNYTKNVEPNPTTSFSNSSFVDWANEEWERFRRGPYSQTTTNLAGMIPLKQLSRTKWVSIVEAYKSQNVASYLPNTYTAELIHGYEAQREILADCMAREDNAVLEFPPAAAGTTPLMLTKPVSRGTVTLNQTDVYAEPILDYGTHTNPVDVLVASEAVRFSRRFHQTPTMNASFAPVEVLPGPGTATTDEELEDYTRSTAGSTTGHLSGTCAMMPREMGGVVSPDLLVYGVTGLSVADSSIMPLIPGAHTCATVYAVAEKAADIIKARH